MPKYVINFGGKVHNSTSSGTVDKGKFQINQKGSEQKGKEDTSKKEEKERK